MSFANLCRDLRANSGSNRYLDGLLYASLQRRQSTEDESIIADAYVGEREGTVVVRYTSGTHGTCSAPRYTSSLDEVLAEYRRFEVPIPAEIYSNPREAMASFLVALETVR